MAKFHYTEKFYSIQGEGRYMGVPSVFLRMFGCNFRCKNFGRYEQDILGIDQTHNPEVIEVIKNLDHYKTFKDLPLIKTGCDSYSSVYPEFKEYVIKETADELANSIVDLLPFKNWNSEHLVITGGEPLLGWQRLYPELLEHDKMAGLKELTFETNGTQLLTDEFYNYLDKDWQGSIRRPEQLTFSVSVKLSSSGESSADAIKPDVLNQFESIGFTYLKFVVSTESDVNEALAVKAIFRDSGFEGPVYLMPVGGVESVYSLNNRRVAEYAMKHGLRYSDRLQVPLFKNAWGT